MLMVIAAGNENWGISYPGVSKNVITVGAVKDGNSPNLLITWPGVCQDYNWPPGERVCISNFGPVNLDADGSTRIKPDLVAPGVNIISTMPNNWYYYDHGTSMAAPAVAGVAASVLDAYSSASPWLFNYPETVKALLLATAVDIGGNTYLYGRGQIDAYHAVQGQPGVAGPPTFWGGLVTTTTVSLIYTFSVPTSYAEVRVALTWPDAVDIANGDAVNDLDLFVYSNSTCTGGVAGSSVTVDDTVEYVRIPAGRPSGTWCIKVNGFRLISAQYFGLAAFPIRMQPNLTISPNPASLQTPRTVVFSFDTLLANSGNTAGGSYLTVEPPSNFDFEYAIVYSAGLPRTIYTPNDLYYANNRWHIATGEVIKDFPRKVSWFFRATVDATVGAHTFVVQASYRNAGTTTLADTDTVIVNVTAQIPTYLPFVTR